jgi:hypothetical protein
MIKSNLKGKWVGIFKELPDGAIELDFTEEVKTVICTIN